jgi:glycosyltransferase involved in cell wall biosynthesis
MYKWFVRKTDQVLMSLTLEPTENLAYGKLSVNQVRHNLRLVLLAHPASLGSVSMPRFAAMISRAMIARGHDVEIWTSPQRIGAMANRLPFVRKWLGYVDQFLIYPHDLRGQINRQPDNTLFVVTDQALGMWVPQLVHRPHVIHCHDFMALKSALGKFPENPTGWTGRQYQRLICGGFSQGKIFISVSEKTKTDLHHFLPHPPKVSKVVHNGLNHPFRPMDLPERLARLKPTGIEISESGFIVHVGGNQWYKNRPGVLKIYEAMLADNPHPPALWMVGPKPSDSLLKLAAAVPAPGKVHFLSDLSNEQVNAVYAHARALLFPSLEEGFGWPIIEGMASGCPVITTDTTPMSEIAGGVAYLIPRMPQNPTEQIAWANGASKVMYEVLRLPEDQRFNLMEQGKSHAARFKTETAIAAYEEIYLEALAV